MAGKRFGYPRITVKMWWKLRKEIQNSPDVILSPDNIVFLLNTTLSTAKTVILPPLRTIGIISKTGSLTDLGRRWLIDSEYRAACQEMTDRLYPDDLNMQVKNPARSREAVIKWFSKNTTSNAITIQHMAATYLLIRRADPTEQNGKKVDKTKAKLSKKKGSIKRISLTKTSQALKLPDTFPNHNGHTGLTGHVPHQNGTNKEKIANISQSISLNINIVISNDATARQIESLFSSLKDNVL